MKPSEQEVKADFTPNILIIALLPIALTFQGYILATTWKWFVRPLWDVAPVLTVPISIGLLTVQWAWKGQSLRDEKLDKAKNWDAFGLMFSNSFYHPAITLLIAWIVHRFWM